MSSASHTAFVAPKQTRGAYYAEQMNRETTRDEKDAIKTRMVGEAIHYQTRQLMPLAGGGVAYSHGYMLEFKDGSRIVEVNPYIWAEATKCAAPFIKAYFRADGTSFVLQGLESENGTKLALEGHFRSPTLGAFAKARLALRIYCDESDLELHLV